MPPKERDNAMQMWHESLPIISKLENDLKVNLTILIELGLWNADKFDWVQESSILHGSPDHVVRVGAQETAGGVCQDRSRLLQGNKCSQNWTWVWSRI